VALFPAARHRADLDDLVPVQLQWWRLTIGVPTSWRIEGAAAVNANSKPCSSGWPKNIQPDGISGVLQAPAGVMSTLSCQFGASSRADRRHPALTLLR
jgi:hypothetical protein